MPDSSVGRTEWCVMEVDLHGSRLGSAYLSARVVVDTRSHTADEMRGMCAAHYGIPISQVGSLIPATIEDIHHGR